MPRNKTTKKKKKKKKRKRKQVTKLAGVKEDLESIQ